MEDGPAVSITASFGVATMGEDKTIEEVIDQADRALLCAKAEGRNRVCVWNA